MWNVDAVVEQRGSLYTVEGKYTEIQSSHYGEQCKVLKKEKNKPETFTRSSHAISAYTASRTKIIP